MDGKLNDSGGGMKKKEKEKLRGFLGPEEN